MQGNCARGSRGRAVIALGGQLRQVVIPDYRGWVTGARWTRRPRGSSEAVYVFSIHVPTHRNDAPRQSYIREACTIIRRITAIAPRTAPLIIGGDCNFASFGERVDAEQRALARSERHALDEFWTQGFLVAWRGLHPGLPLPQILRWTGDRTTPL